MSTHLTQRTRFRYLVGDKVTVTLLEGQQRTGVIEARVEDPTKKPYLVGYDPMLADPEPDPVDGFFEDHQIRRNLSAPFTVCFEEGARDVYERIVRHLARARSQYVALSTSVEEAREREAEVAKMAESFWTLFTHLVMRANPYDGTLHITPDSYAGDCLSLLFRYQRSGLEGGLIFHGKPIGGADRHPLLGEWSLHS